MKIGRLGEFGLIEHFRKQIKTDSSVIKGSGDDCAVLRLDKKNFQLFTCDLLVEDVDFTLKDPAYLIGRKAIAVSISDIAACSGLPRHCVISLGLPKPTSLNFVNKMFKGMLDICKEYSINIVGGDISRSKKIIIDVSMVGQVEKRHLTLRNGACEGDTIFVTGELGGSISGKHLSFFPRIKEARFLAKNFKVGAMIDISDGLAQDLKHILDQSNTGAIIYEDLLAFSKDARNLSDVLYAGEDFELLFTLSPGQSKKLLNRKLINFKPIGEIVKKKHGFKLLDKDGRLINLTPKGFRHF